MSGDLPPSPCPKTSPASRAQAPAAGGVGRREPGEPDVDLGGEEGCCSDAPGSGPALALGSRLSALGSVTLSRPGVSLAPVELATISLSLVLPEARGPAGP